MKTKQEQIEKMARSMCGYCSTDGKCAVSKNGREPDICANVDTEHCLYKEYAERLIESGYGDVSEYKAEIERLRQEVRDTDKMARNTIEQYKNNYDNAFERLKAQEREIQSLREANIDLKEELYELHDELDIARAKKDKTIKQTQIDLLNKVKKYLHTEDFDTPDERWKPESEFCAIINELIKEVQNAEDKG